MEEGVEHREFEFALGGDILEESGLHGVKRFPVRVGDDEVTAERPCLRELREARALPSAVRGRWRVARLAVSEWCACARDKWLSFVGEEKCWRVTPCKTQVDNLD